MTKRLLMFYAALLVCSLAYSQPWLKWNNLGNGIESASAQIELFNSHQTISAVRYKTCRHRLVVMNECGAAADSTSALAMKAGALAAVNGSYFNVRELTPQTFIKEKGIIKGSTTPDELFRVDGMMCMRGRNLVFMACDTAGYVQAAEKYKEAMAAGPLLLLNGKAARESWPSDSFFTKRHPRTFVGTTKDGYTYLVVIDGRFPLGTGTTIAETLELARMMGLENALNLDGGGSSTIWTKSEGVLNHPYDNKKYDHFGQRIVPNVLLVY